MSVFDAEADLTLADQVLGDLAPRGGMYVARRKEDGDQETMVIQTGEEGRHRLRLPDMSSSSSIERFLAEAQTHLERVFGRPLPGCLAHDHALRGVVEGGQVWWVCPDGGWRCQLGDYDDLNWPPAPDERPGDVVAALVNRFARRGIAGWQSASPSRETAPWAVRISVWPMDESVIEHMRRAADPIALDVEQGSPPPTREDVQRGIDRAHEQDVRWAQWAVGCWAGFPVAQRPRQGTNMRADVGGTTAAYDDLASKISSKLPLQIIVVIVLSFLLLMLAFRTIVIPVQAAVMNVLSIGASYGVLTAVFQYGWLVHVIGLDGPVPIVSYVPLFMFAILFGLSMDYEVFLVSQIEEHVHAGQDNKSSVVSGLVTSARVITAAAAIMVFVFGSFVLNGDPTIKQFGVGLAVAVIIDATIVRCLLVPALMLLMGKLNWYMPGWLDTLVPHVSVEGAEFFEQRDREAERQHDELTVA